jgi:ADP-L-glycero-D-manno-heptose 6-epimerase
MKYLVTGGTGFIGSNIAKHLHAQGHNVIVTGTRGEQSLTDIPILDPQHIDWAALGKFDAVFHQAALVDTLVLDEQKMFAANVDFAKHVFENAVAHGCKQIVYASSTATYGDAPAPYIEDVTPQNPLNPYGASKKALEAMAIAFGNEHPDVVLVGLRYCNVYGPGESHKGKMANYIYQLAQQMQAGNPRVFKHGEQKRDHIYVKDVVRANVLAAEAKKSCIVNCGSGTATTFNDIIAILNETLGLNRATEYIDNPYADRYQSHTECDMTQAKEKIGFVPQFDVRAGIKDYHASGFLVKK